MPKSDKKRAIKYKLCPQCEGAGSKEPLRSICKMCNGLRVVQCNDHTIAIFERKVTNLIGEIIYSNLTINSLLEDADSYSEPRDYDSPDTQRLRVRLRVKACQLRKLVAEDEQL